MTTRGDQARPGATRDEFARETGRRHAFTTRRSLPPAPHLGGLSRVQELVARLGSFFGSFVQQVQKHLNSVGRNINEEGLYRLPGYHDVQGRPIAFWDGTKTLGADRVAQTSAAPSQARQVAVFTGVTKQIEAAEVEVSLAGVLTIFDNLEFVWRGADSSGQSLPTIVKPRTEAGAGVDLHISAGDSSTTVGGNLTLDAGNKSGVDNEGTISIGTKRCHGVAIQARGGAMSLRAKTTLTIDGSNDSTADLQVKSQSNTHAVFMDTSTSRVGINNSSPAQALDVTGNIAVSGTVDGVDLQAIPAGNITTGTLAHERGGLEADVSAFSGLVKISGGATSQATVHTDYMAPAAFESLTISGGAVTASVPYIRVTSESGTADDLDTINGLPNGTRIVVEAAVGHTITVKDATGNLQLASDFALNSALDKIQLIRRSAAAWDELSRSNNA